MLSIKLLNTLNKALLVRGFALLMFWSASTHALQVVDVADGTSSFAVISIKEITRLSLSGERLRSLKFTAGALVVDKDEENGQYFIRPQNIGAPINLFVVSESGHSFALVLQPKDIPMEQIVLRDASKSRGSNNISAVEKSSSHEQLLKNFMLLMASGELPKDLDIVQENKEVPLWKEVRFTHEFTYKGETVVGEKFRLTNISAAQLRLAEQEFFDRGVLGVAIDQLVLAPNQSTAVYIVRQKGAENG